jgi:hypothetical protein
LASRIRNVRPRENILIILRIERLLKVAKNGHYNRNAMATYGDLLTMAEAA